MFTIYTENSVYEVDNEMSKVRRVMGLNAPCRFIGEDGVWRDFTDIVSIHTPSENGFDHVSFMFVNSITGKAFHTSHITELTKEETHGTESVG